MIQVSMTRDQWLTVAAAMAARAAKCKAFGALAEAQDAVEIQILIDAVLEGATDD